MDVQQLEHFTATGIRSVSPGSSTFLFEDGPDQDQREWASEESAKASKRAGIDLATQQPPSSNPADFVEVALGLFPERTRPKHSKEVFASCRAKGEGIKAKAEALTTDVVSDRLEALFTSFDYDLLVSSLAGGWNRIGEGGVTTLVEAPEYTSGVFDTETFVKGGNDPIFGQLVTDRGEVFLWVHPDFVSGHDQFQSQVLPSVGEGRLLVAHNAGFDLSRVEQAKSLSLVNDWLCTMGMATATDVRQEDPKLREWRVSRFGEAPKLSEGCGSASLASCYQYYVDPSFKISKDERDIFVKIKGLQELRPTLAETVRYSLLDTLYTYRLLRVVFPIYLGSTPDPISLVGHSQVLQQVVLLSPDYPAWVEAAKETAASADSAKQAIWLGVIREAASWGESLHTQHLDWAPATVKGRKRRTRQTTLPTWYVDCLAEYHKCRRKGQPWKPSQRVGDACLGLFWGDDPIICAPEMRVTEDRETKTKKNVYVRLRAGDTPPVEKSSRWPQSITTSHKREGHLARNGGALWAIQNEALEALVSITVTTNTIHAKVGSTWENCRTYSFGDSILSPVGLNVHGTVSRRTSRGMPPTAKKAAIYSQPFSEQKAMWAPPSTHVYVYADFDSQESRIMALLAEKYVNGMFEWGYAGVSATALINFVGDKTYGTDTHSLYAKSLGVSRNEGKALSLGVQYGQTAKNAGILLHETFPTRFTAESAFKAASDAYNNRVGQKLASGLYVGGTESDAHNMVAQITKVRSHEPFTGTCIQRYFWAENRTPRVKLKQLTAENFVCQAGGAAILSMMTAVVHDLGQRMGWSTEDFRVAFSVHDEIVCVARREIAVEAAVLFNLAHAIVWAKCFERCGVREMPLNSSLFSTVSIDNRYRKEPSAKEATLSTPSGFAPGIELNGIQLVEALNNGVALPDPERPAFQVVATEGTSIKTVRCDASALEAWEERTFCTHPLPPERLPRQYLPPTQADRKADELADLLATSSQYRFGSMRKVAARRERTPKGDDWGLEDFS